MVLRPVKRAVVPSPLEEPGKFDEFVTQYLNKCDDLLSYTQRYPTVKATDVVRVQRQRRSPHESRRWLRRTVAVPVGVTYDELRRLLFANRAEHLPHWMPQLVGCERVESIVPNLCEAVWLGFRSPGLQARRDYCQMVVRREFVGDQARPKPRLFTPAASMASLAQAFHSQSSLSLASCVQPHADSCVGTHHSSPYGYARSHSGRMPAERYAGLSAPGSIHDSAQAPLPAPIRRFQIVTVPMSHRGCPARRGYVRAVYEAYEEIREYADRRVEWVCIYHADVSGWVPAFVADRSVVSALPKEAQALLEYVQLRRPRHA
ncbi:hypothetical protein H4R19_000945 [Coemansia spiralis]|nr:hypothetical protein H4R19_000945 [Coemansia spiralis]